MKLERLLGILTILLQKDRITAPDLAKTFEVNRRTIGRDIDALCQAGIPIVTYPGAGGGIAIADGFKLDKSVLTVGELADIVAALKAVGSVSEHSQLERTLDKLRLNSNMVVAMHEPLIIDLASHYKGQLTEKIKLIKQAILTTQLIEFDYFYEKGAIQRRIEPYYVIFQWSSWYVFGFCRLRQDWRMFKLLRLWNLTLCSQTYTPRTIPSERQTCGVNSVDDIQLIALFDSSERYKLIESYGLNCYTETTEGLLLKLSFTNRDFLISWLLGFGGRVKVLAPDSIAVAIKIAAENILARYK